MEPLQSEPPELDRELATRIRELSAKVALWTTNSERWEKAQAALANAAIAGGLFGSTGSIGAVAFCHRRATGWSGRD